MGGEAALEAQAVAARSVAMALVAASGAICDTTSCQVYVGLPDQYGMTADAPLARRRERSFTASLAAHAGRRAASR